jgi:hypothetical protein
MALVARSNRASALRSPAVPDARMIPTEVAALLDAHIDSIEALDVALLMRRYGSQQLTCALVAARTARHPAEVAAIVARLEESGLVSSVPGSVATFRLLGGASTLHALDALAEVYADDPLRIVVYVSTRAFARMRARAARFAAVVRPDDDDP